MSAFLRREDGSLTLLSLLFFICMFLLGGLAVDMLVFENNRSRLQNLSDRASLAATNLSSHSDPEAVVRSYFEKEGLEGYITEIEVTSDHNGRSVRTVAAQPMKTMFMRMVGTTDLTAPAAATAVESKDNVEVSLVLDNSGSMSTVDGGDGKTRLQKLQTATQTFLDTLYEAGPDPEITVSVVPYSTQANAGPLILDHLPTTKSHGYSHCLDFDATDFTMAAMDMSKTYQQTGHYDGFYQNDNPSYWTCRPEQSQEIFPVSSNPAEIMGRVNALIATGQTSLHLGAKWGVAMLDPSMNPVINNIVAAGGSHISAENADRPFRYEENRGQKVMVLMTDGINTQHYDMAPEYIDGDSNVFLGTGVLEEVLFGTPGLEVKVKPSDLLKWGLSLTEAEFYTVDTGSSGLWVPETWVDGRKMFNAQFVSAPLGTVAAKLGWADLFDRMTPRHYAYEFIYKPTKNSTAYYAFLSDALHKVVGGTKDDLLNDICTAAKAQGIIVYTVGVYSSSHTRDVLGACATNENFFLDVQADDLEEAFQKIARNVVKLRMTQ